MAAAKCFMTCDFLDIDKKYHLTVARMNIQTNLPYSPFLLILLQMFSDDTRKRLENIVKGIVLEGDEDHCTAVRNLLCASFRTSTAVKKDFEGQSLIKKEQAEFLKNHSLLRNWWVHDLPDESSFLTRGGEAKIYLAPDRRVYEKGRFPGCSKTALLLLLMLSWTYRM